MMILFINIFIAFLFIAQETGNERVYYLKGIIVDKQSNEGLIGAKCIDLSTHKSATTNIDGIFILGPLNRDTVSLRMKYLNMEDYDMTIIRSPCQDTVHLYAKMNYDYDMMEQYTSSPPEWKTINADDKFSFRIPPQLQKKHIMSDSYVGKYESGDYTVQYDYGYGVSYGDDVKELSRRSTLIGCKKAIVKTQEREHPEDQYKYVVSVEFKMEPAFSFLISYKDPSKLNIALIIANSITFP